MNKVKKPSRKLKQSQHGHLLCPVLLSRTIGQDRHKKKKHVNKKSAYSSLYSSLFLLHCRDMKPFWWSCFACLVLKFLDTQRQRTLTFILPTHWPMEGELTFFPQGMGLCVDRFQLNTCRFTEQKTHGKVICKKSDVLKSYQSIQHFLTVCIVNRNIQYILCYSVLRALLSSLLFFLNNIFFLYKQT